MAYWWQVQDTEEAQILRSVYNSPAGEGRNVDAEARVGPGGMRVTNDFLADLFHRGWVEDDIDPDEREQARFTFEVWMDEMGYLFDDFDWDDWRDWYEASH